METTVGKKMPKNQLSDAYALSVDGNQERQRKEASSGSFFFVSLGCRCSPCRRRHDVPAVALSWSGREKKKIVGQRGPLMQRPARDPDDPCDARACKCFCPRFFLTKGVLPKIARVPTRRWCSSLSAHRRREKNAGFLFGRPLWARAQGSGYLFWNFFPTMRLGRPVPPVWPFFFVCFIPSSLLACAACVGPPCSFFATPFRALLA